MMLLDHGSDGEPKADAQLGQHPPCRTAVAALGASGLLSCLRTWPPELADMAGTRPQVVTMSLSTVPSVDCKRAAAAAGPSSG